MSLALVFSACVFGFSKYLPGPMDLPLRIMLSITAFCAWSFMCEKIYQWNLRNCSDCKKGNCQDCYEPPR